MAAAARESDENVCLNELEPEEASPEAEIPAANIMSRVGSSSRSVMQEVLMTMLDISRTGAMLTLKSTASRKFPAKFFTEMVNSVLDSASGKFLERRHLMKHPKYKAIWGNSFVNGVGRLAQDMNGRISKEKATNTMFFIKENEIPHHRRRYVTYARIVCNYCDQRKLK